MPSVSWLDWIKPELDKIPPSPPSCCSIRLSVSLWKEKKTWFCAMQADLINTSSSKMYFVRGCWETKIQCIRKDGWLLSWLTHNSLYQQREYFLCAWCWLCFPVWGCCQEGCFNSEILVDGWDCLKDSHPVCKFENISASHLPAERQFPQSTHGNHGIGINVFSIGLWMLLAD